MAWRSYKALENGGRKSAENRGGENSMRVTPAGAA